MSRTGYAKATVADIAKAANVSLAVVHHHFAGKHEVLVAAIERLASAAQARLTAHLLQAKDDPHDRLRAFVDSYVGLGSGADPKLVAAWVVVGTEALRDPEVRALYREVIVSGHQSATALVEARLRAEGRSTENAVEIGAAIIAFVEGAFRVATTVPRTFRPGFAAPMLYRMIDGLIAAERCT
jgi:TetR/AcrR family transcriptional repressor of bet genes